MKRFCLFFSLILSMLSGGCDSLFERPDPGPEAIIRRYFPEAAETPECVIEYSYRGAVGGTGIKGVLSCPPNVIEEIIQNAKLEGQFEVADDCYKADRTRRCLESSEVDRSALHQLEPLTSVGIWTLYDRKHHVSNAQYYNFDLFYHEDSGRLFFSIAID